MSLTELARSELMRTDGPMMMRRGALQFADRAMTLAHRHALPSAGVRRLLAEAAQPAPPSRAGPPPSAPGGSAASTGADALGALVKYIPTESATLYVAAMSARASLQSTAPALTPTLLYWFFAALTPVLLFVIVAGQRRTNGLPPMPSLSNWPWWKMFAATVAFLAWGLAVPDNPYNTTAATGATFAFLAVLVSTGLHLLEPLFEPRATVT